MKTNTQGNCAKCNGKNIEYGNTTFDGDSMGYIYKCNDCQSNGKEWYNLVYDETIGDN